MSYCEWRYTNGVKAICPIVIILIEVLTMCSIARAEYIESMFHVLDKWLEFVFVCASRTYGTEKELISPDKIRQGAYYVLWLLF